MPTLSELFVELKLNAESFNNGLKQAQREAKEFEKNLKPTLEVTKDLGVAMAAAGGAVVASLAAASKSAVDYGDKLNDARMRTGATVETLAKLGFAAEQSGSSFEGVSTGLKFLAKNMEAAIAKGGDQRAAFNELGITSKELAAANGDVNKVFLMLADRFKELPEGTERSALAMRIFGKAGGDLIPILLEGSAGIKELGDQAEKAGLVISQDFASASDKLNDTLNEVKASAMGASVGIATALLPALQSVASFASEAGAQFAAFTKEHPALIQAVGALGLALLSAGSALTAIAIVVPKVQAGFLLMQAAAAGLGVTITATTLGVVALGAAVGVAIGLFINWAIEGTRLQKTLDSFVDGTLKKLGFQWESTSEAQKSAAFTAAAITKQQKELNTEIDKAVFVGPKLVKAKVDEAKAAKDLEEALKKEKETRELVQKGFQIMLETRIQESQLLPKINRLQFESSEAIKAAGDAAVQAAADLASFKDTVSDSVKAMEQARYNAQEMDKDFKSISKSDPGINIGRGFESAADAIKKNTEEAKRLKDATDDVKNSAGKIFDDMFIKGESVFSSLGNALKGGALSLGRAIFEDVVGQLLGPIKLAFDDFFKGLLEGTGFKALISSLGSKLGVALSGIFSGGGSTASAAASGASSAAGGVSSVAGGLASSATGILGGVIGGGISAIGSFLANRQLEGTMNAVEYNTRATSIELADTMELILQPMLARLVDIKAELYNHKYLPDIATAILGAITNGSPTGTTGTPGGSAVGNVTFNVYQMSGEDGASFARRIAEELNRYVQFSGGRLIASGLNI